MRSSFKKIKRPNGMPKVIEDVAELNFEGATSTYTGRARTCCCGCAGVHRYTATAVARQIDRIKKLVAEGYVAEVGRNYVSVEVASHGANGRMYNVYFC